MEYVNCNLCGADDTRVLFRKKDKCAMTNDEFQVVECKHCGLFYVNPRPTEAEIKKFYPEAYSWKEKLEAGLFLKKYVRRLEKTYRYHLLEDEVSKVKRFTGRSSGRVLDIGCGTGDRLDVFRKKGFETYGIEISDSADYAKEYLNLNVLKRNLFSAGFPNQFFDIVTLYNVLEHTHDPTAICIEIHRILKDDGFLIIQVPNKKSFQYRIFKEKWAAFDVPRDLYYFETETLILLMRKVGFTVKKIDHFMNWWHPPTLVISLFPTLDPQKAWRKEHQGKNPVIQRLLWIFFTFLAIPFTQLESWFGKGAIVTFYTVKNSRLFKCSTGDPCQE